MLKHCSMCVTTYVTCATIYPDTHMHLVQRNDCASVPGNTRTQCATQHATCATACHDTHMHLVQRNDCASVPGNTRT